MSSPRLRVRPVLPRFLAAVLMACAWLAGAAALGQGPAAGGAAAIPVARQASNIAVITIRDKIDSTTLASVKRRIELADRAGADAIVFELDTPGGELGAVLGICDAIKSSPV